MLFEGEILPLRKAAQLRALPPVPVGIWTPPREFPRLGDASVLAFDVETFDPELLTAGPGWARGRGHIVGVSVAATDRQGNTGAWYFPMRHTVGGEDNLDPRGVLGWLGETLSDPRQPKVGANLLYDLGWLGEEGVEVTGELYDVQYAEALIDETARVALDTLGFKYLGVGKETDLLREWIDKAYKPLKGQWRSNIYRSPPALVGKYGEQDSLLPLRIIRKQWPILQEQGLIDLFKLECGLIPLYIKMRRAGVSVDVERTEELAKELAHDTNLLYRGIKDNYGFTLDSCSAANLSRLLDHMGVDYKRGNANKNNPLGVPTFEKEWLETLDHPIGKIINNIREHEKINGTFLQSYILDKNVNGKLYPQFHPLKGDANGTIVGRLSSSDPNLQNIPSRTDLGKKVRECFIPDPDHSHWLKADYSQVHYRILANYAVDGLVFDFNAVANFWASPHGTLWGGNGSADALRQRYISNPATDYHMDVYNNVAPLLGWSLTDEKEIKHKRRPIKNTNFGLMYGSSEKTITYKYLYGMPTGFFDAYHAGAPYVKSTMAAIGNEVQRNGYVSTVLGRRVRFNLWEPAKWGERSGYLSHDAAIRQWGSNIRRAFGYRGINYKFQGSEPDIMKTGMRALLRSGVLDYVGVPRLTVHDELDWSVRERSPEMNEAFRFVQHTMETAIKLRVPIRVDVSTGPNWGKAD